ncbi:MAG: DUF177 domain-containing protein [Ilumatobacteraceae bacterium]
MDDGHRALRVNTVEMRRRPGVTRDIELDLSSSHLHVPDERLDAPIAIELHATSTVDGIVVTGAVVVQWHDECRRCLAVVARREAMEIDEMYQEEAVDPDAFEIGPDALDLFPMVRDAVVLALADPPPLCRPDCAGICPVCGADRNVSPCGCDTSQRDERWAALDGLVGPDVGPDTGPDVGGSR